MASILPLKKVSNGGKNKHVLQSPIFALYCVNAPFRDKCIGEIFSPAMSQI